MKRRIAEPSWSKNPAELLGFSNVGMGAVQPFSSSHKHVNMGVLDVLDEIEKAPMGVIPPRRKNRPRPLRRAVAHPIQSKKCALGKLLNISIPQVSDDRALESPPKRKSVQFGTSIRQGQNSPIIEDVTQNSPHFGSAEDVPLPNKDKSMASVTGSEPSKYIFGGPVAPSSPKKQSPVFGANPVSPLIQPKTVSFGTSPTLPKELRTTDSGVGSSPVSGGGTSGAPSIFGGNSAPTIPAPAGLFGGGGSPTANKKVRFEDEPPKAPVFGATADPPKSIFGASDPPKDAGASIFGGPTTTPAPAEPAREEGGPAKKKRGRDEDAAPAAAAPASIFGATTSTDAAPAGASIFGAATNTEEKKADPAPAAGGLFGSTSAATTDADKPKDTGASIFGGGAAAGGDSGASIFGSAAPAAGGASIFGGGDAAAKKDEPEKKTDAAPSTSIFGGASADKPAESGGGIFGGAAATTEKKEEAPAAGTSIFGSAAPAAGGASIFGGASTTEKKDDKPADAGTSIFGSAAPAAGGASIFGGAATTETKKDDAGSGGGIFGGGAAAPASTDIFSTNKTQLSTFSNSTNSKRNSSTIYMHAPAISPIELKRKRESCILVLLAFYELTFSFYYFVHDRIYHSIQIQTNLNFIININ